MDVDASVLVRVEKLRWQNLSVSYDDRGICLMRSEQLLRLLSLNLGRLMNGQIVLKREFFDRGLMKSVSSPCRLVGLRPHRDDLVTIIKQSPQRRYGGIGRAHENNAHKCFGDESDAYERLSFTSGFNRMGKGASLYA